MTLYENGTLDLETAAKQAGIPTDRLQRAVRRASGETPTATTETERVPLHAD
jgi:transcriptional/translational regulatory protein YebC/TACO1